MTSPPELKLAQIDAVLAFLPVFERPGFSSGQWRAHRAVFPVWEAEPAVGAFVEALYREQFIVPFDWGAWAEEARRYAEGGEAALATADLTTLRKLLTTYVRADRFTAGTLAGMFDSGHIVAILRRLRQIRATMG